MWPLAEQREGGCNTPAAVAVQLRVLQEGHAAARRHWHEVNTNFGMCPQGRLTDRVLPLLWRLALAEPLQTSTDGPSKAFIDALFRYDAVQQERHLEHE